MKLNKPRRLSLRAPVIGWEAYISTKRSKNTRAKIGNVSADGAYLITKEQYQPASKVTLSIKSPIICFSVTGMVVRNDPHGVAVRFLDHSKSTRNSLLRLISKLLSEKRSNQSGLKKTPIRSESQPKLNLDSEQECFYTSALLSTAPGSEAPRLAKSNSNRSKDNNFMTSSAQTHCAESSKVFLNHCGTTTVECPLCKKCHYTTVPEHFRNKPVRAKCECGQSFPVLFDSRKYFRKEVRLSGEYWDTSGVQYLMTVTTLSVCGAGFEASRGNLLLNEGETIQINFSLNNNDRNWIKLKAVVKWVKGDQVGVEFTELNDHQRKCIGFYLMP
ncbi:MAG: PilZ domain-containing protein [Deltaproteobacteria bacterium]|nr:PilZ domain-containing protein [Deltaproteobacteria bacterium]